MIQRNNFQKIFKIFILLSLFIFLIPISYSNGGCIKVEDDVLVQLSSAPLVPVVNQQTSFLISFGNIKKELISKEIVGNLSIVKNDEIILTRDFKIKDGILDLKYTFKSQGLYEIYLKFNINGKNYEPEDFLIEVIDNKNTATDNFLFLTVGIVIGILIIFLFKIKRKK